MSYPLPCERFDAEHPCDLAKCETCDHEWTASPETFDHDAGTLCPKCGHLGWWKWEEASKCANCGKFGFDLPFDRACSRRCQLQAEHAATLKRDAA